MRILFLTENFPPETKSCSTLFFELGESLVKKGHRVTVVTRKPRTNIASGTDLNNVASKEILAGIEVHRFQTPPLARNIPFLRGFEHFWLAWIFFWGVLFVDKFDVIFVYSPPLPLGITAYWLARIKGGATVINIQDLYPQTVIDLGLLKNRFLIWLAKRMEDFIYRRSDFITVHSEGNKEYVVSRGAPAKNVDVVYNWVDTELVKPGDKDNPFSRKLGLAGKYVVSFAGVMGFAQGLDVVIKAAEILIEKKDVVFIFVGDGVKKNELENLAGSLKLDNVKFVPTQPVEIYPQILSSSDLCLAVLDKLLVTPVVPGKILSIMAAGKPVLASLALVGDAPKLIEKYGCGLAVEPGRPDLIAQAIIKLYNDRKLAEEMGKRGREAAVRNFSRAACVDKYDGIFKKVLNRGA